MEYPMVLSPNNYRRERILFGGVEQPLQSIYEESSTQKYALGQKLVYGDGRVFRYARNGAVALSKALMTSSAAISAYALEELQSTYGANIDVGDYEFDIDVTTGGTWVENEYENGFLVVNKATGIGDIYKIRANKIDASDDTLMKILLETPIRTALDATSELTFIKHPQRDVIVMPTTAEGTPAGVPLIDVTINYFCWLQTGGIAPLIVDTSETLVKGGPVGYPGTPNVAGAVGDVEAATDAIWGIAVYIATAAECALVDLKLDF